MKSILNLVIVSGLSLAGIGCSEDACQSDAALGDKIKKEVLAAASQKAGHIVDFTKIADFDWDELAVLPPYTMVEDLRQDGVETECLKKTNIESRDDITVLAFLKNKQVIKRVEYPIWPGDFTRLRKGRMYILLPKKSAVFSVKADTNRAHEAAPYYEFVQAAD